MDYSKLVAVSGLPGIFELVNSKTDGAIVRSLDDNTNRFVSSRIHQFSHLEGIEVYTVKDNVNLVEIFHAMENEDGKLPDEKDAGAVRKYFEKVYPDLDFDKVYSSDLKKMIKWFSALKKNNIEIKLSEIPEEPAEPEETETPETVAEEKPSVKEKTKPATKKAATSEKPKKEAAADKTAKKKSPGKKK